MSDDHEIAADLVGKLGGEAKGRLDGLTLQSLVTRLNLACKNVQTIPNSAARLFGDAANVIEQLEQERNASVVWAKRLKSYLSEGSFQTIESEMAWKRRAETAERRLERYEWKTIDTAPKDRTIQLWIAGPDQNLIDRRTTPYRMWAGNGRGFWVPRGRWSTVYNNWARDEYSNNAICGRWFYKDGNDWYDSEDTSPASFRATLWCELPEEIKDHIGG